MKQPKTAAVILAAGKGTRMKSRLPKVMHPIAGRPMVLHVLATLSALKIDRSVVVVGPGMESVATAVAPSRVAVQEKQLGTGHAVMAAREALKGFAGDVLVLYGDTPLLSAGTLRRVLAALRRKPRPAVVVLGFEPADPGAYGRLVLARDGSLDRIVEYRDASAAERAIRLCNSGVMAVDGRRLFTLLGEINNRNAKREYYLTDIVARARARRLGCAVVRAPAEELLGVNSRAELASAEAVVQARLRGRALDRGATLLDPSSVYFAHDTVVGRDVTIGPGVVFGPGVRVGDDVEIRAFCHIEGATIAAGAVIGPFARLRPGAVIGAGAHIGNYVEVKQATIEAGAKANHLSYIGDAHVGSGANVGAGTITCNYDGFFKSKTVIGRGAFIGSNSALVAPVTVGDGAIIGAGSVITRDVEADALAVTRADQRDSKGWAARFRRRRAAQKAALKANKARG
ncbi:MAG: bifunctional UDP-N-acetylglucosamine diphosphorylase/glucosamine-1-phosphate N-acetyltransferase GlmU [Alphaproteobacteria bacterium]